ncbi:MAG: phosphoribosylformylglycinamidine synthase subunit PurS [Gemmatimonadota bacterium]|nr:phosphoribosylformylglycinamidine synthase subunit PurS [Gemmatimonadota bacterium]MDH3423492.1 phosphoribosylformylglycinamidine synthase subunit PurS [Gemmatimonadota bacterium]
MTRYSLEVRIKPRPGLLDPEGKAIHHALQSLGWGAVDEVRVGKVIYIDLEAESEAAATETATAMCRKILANPVTEDFQVSMAVGVPAGKLEGAQS